MDGIRILLEDADSEELNGLVWYVDGRPRYHVRIQKREFLGDWDDVEIVLLEGK